MLSVKVAAQTRSYRESRAKGCGVVDAIAGARWSNALRTSVLDTIRESKKRSKAARKGWKTRRKNA